MINKTVKKNIGKHRPEPPFHAPTITTVSTEKCRTCFWRGSIEGVPICDYIGKHNGRMRPCKPGDACTEYITEEDYRKEMAGKMKIDYEKAMELYNQGMTDDQIAKELGCTKWSIGQWRREKGLDLNKGKSKSAEKEPIHQPDYREARRELHAAGASDAEIAEKTETTVAQISRWRRLNGLLENKAEVSESGNEGPENVTKTVDNVNVMPEIETEITETVNVMPENIIKEPETVIAEREPEPENVNTSLSNEEATCNEPEAEPLIEKTRFACKSEYEVSPDTILNVFNMLSTNAISADEVEITVNGKNILCLEYRALFYPKTRKVEVRLHTEVDL